MMNPQLRAAALTLVSLRKFASAAPQIPKQIRPADMMPENYGSSGAHANPSWNASPRWRDARTALNMARADNNKTSLLPDPRFQQAASRFGGIPAANHFQQFPVIKNLKQPTAFSPAIKADPARPATQNEPAYLNLGRQTFGPKAADHYWRSGYTDSFPGITDQNSLTHESIHAAYSKPRQWKTLLDGIAQGKAPTPNANPYPGFTPKTNFNARVANHEVLPGEQAVSLTALKRYLSSTPEARVMDKPETAGKWIRDTLALPGEDFKKKTEAIGATSPEAVRTLNSWYKLKNNPTPAETLRRGSFGLYDSDYLPGVMDPPTPVERQKQLESLDENIEDASWMLPTFTNATNRRYLTGLGGLA